MGKLFLFDCDQTLWSSRDNDYISSVISPLKLKSADSIVRVVDGKIFKLRSGVAKTFRLINNSDNSAGIVSDNQKDIVITALTLFDILKFIKAGAVNVRLWKGYCPKEKMILEILNKKEFRMVKHKNVYWFDDKNYQAEAKGIGINFVGVKKDASLLKKVREILDRLE